MSTKPTVFRPGIALAVGGGQRFNRPRSSRPILQPQRRARPPSGQACRDGHLGSRGSRMWIEVDGGSHSTRGAASCSAVQGSWMVSPGGRAGVRVVPSLPSPGSLKAVGGCRTGGSTSRRRRKPGLTRRFIGSRRKLCRRRLRSECGRVWAGDLQGGPQCVRKCLYVWLSVSSWWSKGPRVHGWTGCRSLDVCVELGQARRQSVSKPSASQAELQHRWLGGGATPAVSRVSGL